MKPNACHGLQMTAFAMAVCFSCSVSAKGKTLSEQICATTNVGYEVRRSSDSYMLDITLYNSSSDEFEMYDFYLAENILEISATRTIDGSKLARAIPLLAPNTKNIVLKPGQKVKKQINLSTMFPEMQKSLDAGSIALSIGMQVAPLDSCFRMNTAAVISLPQTKTKEGKARLGT